MDLAIDVSAEPMPPNPTDPQNKSRQFEEFESRIVMTAQAVASVLPDAVPDADADPGQNQAYVATESIQDASALSVTTAAAQLAAQYGLDGTGQTIAVIDSGIAFDHVALGGGYGEGYQVVGGYDFAEDDANPYDDGPTGFHGTHVAGIIGSNDLEYQGVASGADLVALRVFDDAGTNQLEWVEEALQWVHDNQYSFENPITTVNLSLGTSPGEEYQAILEDEFAQLEADGIFISVAAGNSFDEQYSSELAYPASSSSVVPVASVSNEGELSDFSQRASNVLVAPGEGIVSTVPESLFFGAKSDPFVGASGTSQAAPYVAGVSALLRQANEIVGTENIDQDLLYDQLFDTADQVFDSVTGSYYAQVNLQAALESVFAGSTTSDANQTRAGESSATDNSSNAVATDTSFATIDNGVLTIAGTQQNDSISLEVKGLDASQLSVVLNGQSQDFALSQIQQIVIQGNGGNDALSVTLGDGITSKATNDVVTLRHQQVDVLNEFFQLTATNIANATINNGAGSDSLVSQGSSGSDQLRVTANQVTFQNSTFRVSTGQYSSVYANGQQGSDSVELEGSTGNDLFAERERTSYLETDSQTVFVEGFEQVDVDGNGGRDQANLGATSESEAFELNFRDASIEQSGRTVEIEDFARINLTDADGE